MSTYAELCAASYRFAEFTYRHHHCGRDTKDTQPSSHWLSWSGVLCKGQLAAGNHISGNIMVDLADIPRH